MSSRRLAAVVAHPDDDTFGCAGTVALHTNDPDFHFVLIHVTSGENGQIAEGSDATPETLGEVREAEDRRSWEVLGRVPDRHEWLRVPDHAVADHDTDELVERIAAVLREERPDVVMTFGPDGVTGHPDHIAVGEVATQAFHRVREEGVPGFSRLLHQAIPQSMLDRWNEELVAKGQEPMDPTQMYQPRGVPDEQVGVRVDCTGRRDAQARRRARTRHADRRHAGAHRGRGPTTAGARVRDPRGRVARHRIRKRW